MRLFITTLLLVLIALSSCNFEEKVEITVSDDAKVLEDISLDNRTQKFWDNLVSICGNAYSGKLTTSEEADPDVAGKQLIMHIRQCSPDTIKIPFFIEDDYSRTWVITRQGNRLQLKHDHRHQDGTEDEQTQYGGMSVNSGLEHTQMFVADQYTLELIEYAAFNVWLMELVPNEYFSYTLRRSATDRIFKVVFDLTKTIETPSDPWGWSE